MEREREGTSEKPENARRLAKMRGGSVRKTLASFLLVMTIFALASCAQAREFPMKAQDVRRIMTMGAIEKKYGEPDEINGRQRVFYDVACGDLTGKLYVIPDMDVLDEAKEESPVYFGWGYQAEKGKDGDLRESPAVRKIIEKLDASYGMHFEEETDPGDRAMSWTAYDGSPGFTLTLVVREDELWIETVDVRDP